MITTVFYTLILAIDMLRYSFQLMALAFLGALVLPSIIAFAISLVATIVTFFLSWIFKSLAGLFYALALGLAWFPPAAAPLTGVAVTLSGFALTMYGLFITFMVILLIALALMIFLIVLYNRFVNGTSSMLQAIEEVENGSNLE